MQRKPHSSENVFVIPVPGFEIVYFCRTGEILSLVSPEPVSSGEETKKGHQADAETRKKAS